MGDQRLPNPGASWGHPGDPAMPSCIAINLGRKRGIWSILSLPGSAPADGGWRAAERLEVSRPSVACYAERREIALAKVLVLMELAPCQCPVGVHVERLTRGIVRSDVDAAQSGAEGGFPATAVESSHSRQRAVPGLIRSRAGQPVPASSSLRWLADDRVAVRWIREDAGRRAGWRLRELVHPPEVAGADAVVDRLAVRGEPRVDAVRAAVRRAVGGADERVAEHLGLPAGIGDRGPVPLV